VLRLGQCLETQVGQGMGGDRCELAAELGVNKNTVSKAYALLAREGVSRWRWAAAPLLPARRGRALGGELPGRAGGARAPARAAGGAAGGHPPGAGRPGGPQGDRRVLRGAGAPGPARRMQQDRHSALRPRAERAPRMPCRLAADRGREGRCAGCDGDLRGTVLPPSGLGRPHPCRALAAIHIAPHPAMLLQVIEAAQAMQGRVGLICGNPSSVARFSSLFRSYTLNEIQIAHYRDAKRMTGASSVKTRQSTSEGSGSPRPRSTRWIPAW
jgi:hypothetical protein